MAWLVQLVAGLRVSRYTLLTEAGALLVGLFMAQRLLAGAVELRWPLRQTYAATVYHRVQGGRSATTPIDLGHPSHGRNIGGRVEL